MRGERNLSEWNKMREGGIGERGGNENRVRENTKGMGGEWVYGGRNHSRSLQVQDLLH
jgi:hypothetical protein